MSDISNQLIKDSYDYVLQSDLVTGIVYRIGGNLAINPIFSSGLTVNGAFKYSDGSESNGYVLTSDGSGNATWKAVSAATPSSGVTSITVGTGLSADSTTGAVTIVYTGQTSFPYLSLSGGTVTGDTIFQSGLTANTISATTYYGITNPTDTYIPVNSGGTFQDSFLKQSGNILGSTIDGVNYYGLRLDFGNNVFSFGDSEANYHRNSVIVNNSQVFLSNNDNQTAFYVNSKVIKTYVDAGPYGGDIGLNLDFLNNKYYLGDYNSLTGSTYILVNNSNKTITLTNITSSTDSHVVTIDGSGVLHKYPISGLTGSSISGAYLPLSGGTVTGGTIFNSGLTANTISATTYQNLPSQSGTGISAFSYNQSTGLLSITKNDTTTLTAGTFNYITATTLSSGNVLSVTSNGSSATTTTINAVTGGTYSNGIITLSGTGNVNGTQITGLSSLTPTTLYSGNGALLSNRVVNLSSYTLNFSSSTNPDTLVMSGGNVGIGTSSPTNNLDVVGVARIQKPDYPFLYIQSTTSNSSSVHPSIILKNSSYSVISANAMVGKLVVVDGINTIKSSIDFYKSSVGPTNIILNGNPSNGNNVLIGSYTDDGYKLNVAGTTRIQDKLTVSATTDPVKFIGIQSSTDTDVLTVDATGVVHKSPLSGLTTGITTTNIYNSNGTLNGNRIVNLSSYTLNFSSSTNPNTLVMSGGNVGIGKVNPTSKLDVNGDINFPNTTGSTYGVIKQNGSTVFHTYGTDNLFLGKNVANFGLTGQRNLGLGQESLAYLTTGNNNVSVGIRSSYNISSGGANVSVGYHSLYSNSGGNSNTAIGDTSLYSSQGNDNVAIGAGALSNNSSGSGNVAIGKDAGYFELGSNKLYIANANTNIRQALIYGEFDNQKVGINTQSPTNALSVYANIDPLQLSNVQTSTDTELLTIDGSGVVHKIVSSAITSGITLSFLRNETHSGVTDTIHINESIFNPSNLTVLSTSVFIIDYNADYYILGDLYNYGDIIVNGTLKVGGIIYNYGTITGPGIIE